MEREHRALSLISPEPCPSLAPEPSTVPHRSHWRDEAHHGAHQADCRAYNRCRNDIWLILSRIDDTESQLLRKRSPDEYLKRKSEEELDEEYPAGCALFDMPPMAIARL